MERPGFPRQGTAAQTPGTACSGHTTGSTQRQGAHGAAATASRPGDLGARGRHRWAERKLLGRAWRAVPWLGGTDGTGNLDGQQEQERPGTDRRGLRHVWAAKAVCQLLDALDPGVEEQELMLLCAVCAL